MSGPCPQGASTPALHKDARCQDRERCTGPGCRVRRPRYEVRMPELPASAYPPGAIELPA